jgi:hypothetical protein
LVWRAGQREWAKGEINAPGYGHIISDWRSCVQEAVPVAAGLGMRREETQYCPHDSDQSAGFVENFQTLYIL